MSDPTYDLKIYIQSGQECLVYVRELVMCPRLFVCFGLGYFVFQSHVKGENTRPLTF